MRLRIGSGLVALLCLGLVCARMWAQGTPGPGPVEATGKLMRVMAVGAETTGWMIELDKEQSFGGKPVHSIEVDGSKKRFVRLENKRVTVSGALTHRSGVESGDRVVLQVEKIKEVKTP